MDLSVWTGQGLSEPFKILLLPTQLYVDTRLEQQDSAVSSSKRITDTTRPSEILMH